MNPEALFSGFNHLISGLSLIIIILVLFYESINDIKYRRISKFGVICLYVMVPIYLFSTGIPLTEASFTFLFTLGIFLGVWALSFGQFGIGDSLVIGALGWMFGNFADVQNFLFILALICIPWGVYWIVHYVKKNGYRDIMKKIRSKIPIEKVKPGMVLANDNFMHGLDEEEIQKMKLKGILEVKVKQPLPFIPAVFLAFILTLI
jgi:prepilin signal peptidase PulO-like enzyme (type II secretory pathway)